MVSQERVLDCLPFSGRQELPFLCAAPLPAYSSADPHTAASIPNKSAATGTARASLAAFPAGAGPFPHGPACQGGPSFPPRWVFHSTPVPDVALRQPRGDARTGATAPAPGQAPRRSNVPLSRSGVGRGCETTPGSSGGQHSQTAWLEEAAESEEFLQLLCPNKSKCPPPAPCPCLDAFRWILPPLPPYSQAEKFSWGRSPPPP